MNAEITINDLPLPRELVGLIDSGLWKAPVDLGAWHSIFPIREVRRPSLYSLELMKKENSRWRDETDPIWFGVSGEKWKPGNIDPMRSLLIGELQPDANIALDYRESLSRPSVVFLTTEHPSYWVKVAADIDSFIKAIIEV